MIPQNKQKIFIFIHIGYWQKLMLISNYICWQQFKYFPSRQNKRSSFAVKVYFVSTEYQGTMSSESSETSSYSSWSESSRKCSLSSSGPSWRPHHSEIIYRYTNLWFQHCNPFLSCGLWPMPMLSKILFNFLDAL